jgi:phosphodiesterase/alkaline phosphatase D-like protein
MGRARERNRVKARRIVSLLAISVLLLASALNAWRSAAAPLRAVEDFSILLGRPEDHSITVNVVPDTSGEISFEYGTTPAYGSQTGATACTANEPVEVVINGLSANTLYYYQLRFRATSGDPWTGGGQHSFRTQRAEGSTFTFTIISDSHLGQYGGQTTEQRALYERSLTHVADEHPDFHIDLGDTFAMDPSPLGTGMTEAEAKAAYLVQRQPASLNIIGADIPFFLALGNHENEEGWNWDDTWPSVPTDGSLAVRGIKQRKLYIPNPVPDGFYTGNIDTSNTRIEGDHLQEDYYAWTWGDALFVVLDPFHYSMTWPNDNGAGYGGEGQDGEASGDRWDWTLGKQQYDWLKATLEGSDANWKFVFLHHLTGGVMPYGRGGIAAA